METSGERKERTDGEAQIRAREANKRKRERSLWLLLDVICNTEWPNDGTGRDRTGSIKVEACDCKD